MSAVHWTAFDDGSWACGGEWPPVVSRRVIQGLVARGLMRMSRRPSELSGGDTVFAVTEAGLSALVRRPRMLKRRPPWRTEPPSAATIRALEVQINGRALSPEKESA